MMEKAGLVRIEVNVSDSFSFNDYFSLLSTSPQPPANPSMVAQTQDRQLSCH